MLIAGSNPPLYGNSEILQTPAFAPTLAPVPNSNNDDNNDLKDGEIAAVVVCIFIAIGKHTTNSLN
jgi:hypothetical protein